MKPTAMRVFECFGYQRGFAVAGEAFDADLFGINGFVGFEIVHEPAYAPLPCPQCAPIVWFAGLAFVG